MSDPLAAMEKGKLYRRAPLPLPVQNAISGERWTRVQRSLEIRSALVGQPSGGRRTVEGESMPM